MCALGVASANIYIHSSMFTCTTYDVDGDIDIPTQISGNGEHRLATHNYIAAPPQPYTFDVLNLFVPPLNHRVDWFGTNYTYITCFTYKQILRHIRICLKKYNHIYMYILYI